MTQAPTPGPLSAEDWASLADLHTLKGWLHGISLTPDWNDVVADGGITVAVVVQQEAAEMAKRVGRVIDNFRLAPTAPVEASGSEPMTEREVQQWIEACNHEPARQVLRDYLAIRPQPSGETRDALARVQGYIDQAEMSNMGSVMVATSDLRALLSARPLALGGQKGEDAAWSWLNQHVECDPADRDYSADEMVDAFMAGAGRYDIWLKALERIAGEQQYRSGYCQTDITVEPALTAEEAQTVARAALSTTPDRAEALKEGAAGVPVAWRETFIVEEEDGAAVGIVIDLPDGSQIWTGECSTQLLEDARSREESPEASGQYLILAAKGEPTRVIAQLATVDDGIALARAIAGHARAHPSPTPAADADRVRSALTDLVSWFDRPVQGERGMVWVIRAGDQGADDAVAEARAALTSESRS
ncbi:hypothetical protein [Brevundimonas sp. UBA7838]|uniref:hypothetical protein n=1 Tax=Brevundimonas sp. UBA7838 TaxID=1946142 RepID=UPI0025C323B0|nr:hypothetical protein [Brevundimonas sp. UBA7838]